MSLRRERSALEELFTLFTQARAQLPRRGYLSVPKLRRAYLRYHTPLNFARASHLLRHVRTLHPSIDAVDHVVDLGCGPGSAALATFYSLPRDRARSYVLHDRNRGILQTAKRLFGRCAAATEADASVAAVSTLTSGWPKLPVVAPRSLVWLSMVLNELPRWRESRAAEPTAELLTRRISPGSVLIVIEPALRGAGRELLRLHDALIAERQWTVIAPCTHQLQCPLLSDRGRSWCHFHFHWHAPPFVTEVASPLGLATPRVSYSYLVAIRGDGSSANKVVPGKDPLARVIGDPMPLRGGRRGVYVCRQGHREIIENPDHNFERGDILVTSDKARPRRHTPWQNRSQSGRARSRRTGRK